MTPQQTQQQLQINSALITSLHVNLASKKKSRKAYNEAADKFAIAAQQADAECDFDKSYELNEDAGKYRVQASLFTPEIKKLRKKLASLAAIQKALKHELGCMQCLMDWEREDDEFWPQEAALAKEGGYVEWNRATGLLRMYPEQFDGTYDPQTDEFVWGDVTNLNTGETKWVEE